MFERFTERARHAIVHAQSEARSMHRDYIGTEHILLGLLREREGVAAVALSTLGVTLDAARAQVVRVVGEGESTLSGQIPFAPRSKKVLELALREALDLGHRYIGTEHLLLALVRENEGVAARILLDFDADAEKVRIAVIRQLSGSAAAEPSNPATEDEFDRLVVAARRTLKVARTIAMGLQLYERAQVVADAEATLQQLAAPETPEPDNPAE